MLLDEENSNNLDRKKHHEQFSKEIILQKKYY